MTLRKMITVMSIAALFFVSAGAVFAGGKSEADTRNYGRGAGQGQSGQGRVNEKIHGEDAALESVLAGLEISPLSAEEEAGLLFMREEEKLARDVYMALYDMYGTPVFRNIGESEQTHMDAVAVLLERYSLSDPAANDAPGQFENEDLTAMYDELVEKGSVSLLAAAEVGVAIEELDIDDLEELIAGSDNEDIALVYNNLLKGSMNHLRSFNRQLDRQGGEYQTGSRGGYSRESNSYNSSQGNNNRPGAQGETNI